MEVSNLFTNSLVLDTIIAIPLLYALGPFWGSLVLLGSPLVDFIASMPFLQPILQTTSELLNSTELVWKPVTSKALTILKPTSEFALQILRPIAEMAIVLIIPAVRSLVIFGYYTTIAVRQSVFTIQNISASAYQTTTEFLTNASTNFVTTTTDAFGNVKEFGGALFTIARGLSLMILRVIQFSSFIVDSFERVSDFGYNLLFKPTEMTWQDVNDIALPFTVVGLVVSYVFLRFYRSIAPTYPPLIKEDKTCSLPRRSSRLARKRSLLHSDSSLSS